MTSNKFTRSLTRATFVALTLTTGFVAASSVGLISVAQAAAPSKLGNLAPFRAIVVDVVTLVNKGDMGAAKKRVTDLESAWDAAEAGIKPRAASDWHLVDKALNHAYDAVRQDKPSPEACKQALADVLATMDKLDGKTR